MRNMEEILSKSDCDVEELQFYFPTSKEKEKLKEILSVYPQVKAAYTGIYAEIFSKDASKGNGLKALSAHLGIEKEEIACIGDGQAALRRTATSKKLSCLNLELYPDSRKVTVHGIELSLTAHEYDLLYLFIKNPEKVYSREMLYDLVWHGGYYGENNTVNVHVSNLRKKIKEADPENEYIRTVYGIGFKLVLHSNKTKFEAVI